MSDSTEHLIQSDGDSTSEYWRDIKDARRQERQENRAVSEGMFAEAAMCAEASGFRLVKHSDAHYSLRKFSKRDTFLPLWILNIYPGNRRIYRDPNTIKKAPFLKLKPDWTLMDVVKVAWFSTPVDDDEAAAREASA